MTEYHQSFGSREHPDREYTSDTVYYDQEEKKWKCQCPDWLEDGKCRHVRFFRAQDTLQVDDGYL